VEQKEKSREKVTGRFCDVAQVREESVVEKVNLVEKFALFDDYWSPKILGELNGQYVKLAKLKGEFVWHHHEAEDELFLVIRGFLTMRLPEKEAVVGEGEFLIVPRGVEHCPVAGEEVHVLLFEPKSTAHTGNVRTEMTVKELDWI
jgi:mannose-6-phosphate isomerase-like protein (cupin superfamily)